MLTTSIRARSLRWPKQQFRLSNSFSQLDRRAAGLERSIDRARSRPTPHPFGANRKSHHHPSSKLAALPQLWRWRPVGVWSEQPPPDRREAEQDASRSEEEERRGESAELGGLRREGALPQIRRPELWGCCANRTRRPFSCWLAGQIGGRLEDCTPHHDAAALFVLLERTKRAAGF